MTIEQMRTALGLGADISDDDVLKAFADTQATEPLLTVDQARDHLLIAEDDGSQDDYLALLIDAAHRSAEHYTDRTLSGVTAEITEADLMVVRQAMLLMIGHWFANREADSVPITTALLLGPLRKWSI